MPSTYKYPHSHPSDPIYYASMYETQYNSLSSYASMEETQSSSSSPYPLSPYEYSHNSHNPRTMYYAYAEEALFPYLHIILNLHSTTISLATITINPSQYHPPHNLEAHQHFLISSCCYFSCSNCSRLVSLRWTHHLVYINIFLSHKSHSSKYTRTNVGRDSLNSMYPSNIK
jgi:hypothetical protein